MPSFPSIRLEGGLLGSDLFDQLLAATATGQKATDFGLDARRNLTDEIAAVFADARSLWGVFQNRLARISDDDPATSITRDAWMIPFLGLLGYEPRYNSRAFEVDGLSFAISHRADESQDAPPIHVVGARQELGRVAASGRPRLAPHSLVQEYLNRTEHVWGIVTNGLTLRLLRDCTFVRRQAYIEFDLAVILEEQRFNDFAVLYRLLHRTRLPRSGHDVNDSLLERYYTRSLEQGGRVREHLREGVEECIKRLANGFLRHHKNTELCRRTLPDCTNNDRIAAIDFYRQLLILVYRFLFLLVSEERGLLSADPVYREHYGIIRIRRMLDSRAAYTEHDDIWQSLRVVWKVLGDEKLSVLLKLAPLNGELFTHQTLDGFTISNSNLLEAFWYLTWYQEKNSGSTPRRVNYSALDVEELGSIYESLLELHPTVDPDASGRPYFDLIFGSGRKETGSYYTPPQLVNELIKSALEPVLKDRLASNPRDPRKALLSIRVCDPACGSGHFLLAAARRIGKELARVMTGEEEPAPERMREAVREVISHCIYGVDRNPLAVDLCRVALWLESHTGEKPLTFLDHRIRCGDSLVGVFNLDVLKDGIPDKAFDPLAEDDKATAREYARRNREERSGQTGLFAWSPGKSLTEITIHSREIDAIDDNSPVSIRRKKQLFEQSHTDPIWLRQKEACDLFTAAFFQPLKSGEPVITSEVLAEHLAGRPGDARILALSWTIANRQRFFHWPLEFPEVFADGGFDVILSNPPWEHVELKEQEFFAARDSRIALAATKAIREKLIKELLKTNPELHSEFIEALRSLDASRLFLATAGRYPLTGRGRINTYAVFSELCRDIIRRNGRCGIIVQSDIATSDTCKFFFQDLIRSSNLISFHDFVNTEGIFPAIHRTHPHFCLLTISGSKSDIAPSFSFWNTNTSHLRDENRQFTLTADEIGLLNPNTGNCPIFRTQSDAVLTKAIYRRVPVLLREPYHGHSEVNPWKIKFSQGLFNLSSDSHHFRLASDLAVDGYRRDGNIFVSPYDRYLPLYEAKMLHQFDHRWATYENDIDARDVTYEEKRDSSFVVQPRYWVREEVVESTIPNYPEPLALALQVKHRPSIQRVLLWWSAGYYLSRNVQNVASDLLFAANRFDFDRNVSLCIGSIKDKDYAVGLERSFPLSQSDVDEIVKEIDTPEVVASALVERFSPKWFLGWRDITNSTNERTLITSVLPRVAVGNSYPLFFMASFNPTERICFEGMANSFVLDYVARQKIGGTHINYFYLKQFPFLTPNDFSRSFLFDPAISAIEWISSRVLELIFTGNDLASLAKDCGYNSSPFLWDEARRFEIRCELDAAFFHLYLHCDANGNWELADGETNDQLKNLKQHFPKPLDAVSYILDQFPITRQKDIDTHDSYRTKERILEIYSSMLDALSTGKPYLTKLSPPPGMRRVP